MRSYVRSVEDYRIRQRGLFLLPSPIVILCINGRDDFSIHLV